MSENPRFYGGSKQKEIMEKNDTFKVEKTGNVPNLKATKRRKLPKDRKKAQDKPCFWTGFRGE